MIDLVIKFLAGSQILHFRADGNENHVEAQNPKQKIRNTSIENSNGNDNGRRDGFGHYKNQNEEK